MPETPGPELTDQEIDEASWPRDVATRGRSIATAQLRRARQVVARHYELVKGANDPLDRGYAEACEDILALLGPEPEEETDAR